MDQLLNIRPEGAQYVLATEIQREGRDSVRPKSDTLSLSWKSDADVLDFEVYAISLSTAVISNRKRAIRNAARHPDPFRVESGRPHGGDWAERAQNLQCQVEEWLCHIPGKLCPSPPSPNLISSSRESASASTTQYIGLSTSQEPAPRTTNCLQNLLSVGPKAALETIGQERSHLRRLSLDFSSPTPMQPVLAVNGTIQDSIGFPPTDLDEHCIATPCTLPMIR